MEIENWPKIKEAKTKSRDYAAYSPRRHLRLISHSGWNISWCICIEQITVTFLPISTSVNEGPSSNDLGAAGNSVEN